MALRGRVCDRFASPMGKTAFISYASADEAIANEISSALEGRGVACWIAPRDVRLGADYGAEIIDGIESSAVFVLVLSEHANASTYVKREVERAVAKGKPIFPMRVADVLPSKSLELFVSSTEWIDAWKPPLEPHVQRLADSIRAVAATGTALPADALLHRRSSARDGSAAAEASRITRPRLVAVIAALCVALLALGVLLATNLRRSPAVPATPDVAAAPAPTRPTPAAVAPSRTATPVAPRTSRLSCNVIDSRRLEVKRLAQANDALCNLHAIVKRRCFTASSRSQQLIILAICASAGADAGVPGTTSPACAWLIIRTGRIIRKIMNQITVNRMMPPVRFISFAPARSGSR